MRSKYRGFRRVFVLPWLVAAAVFVAMVGAFFEPLSRRLGVGWRVAIGRALLVVWLVSSVSACATTSYGLSQPCDIADENRGHPPCFGASERLRTSFDAELHSRPRPDPRLMAQTAGGGSGPSGYSLNGRPGNQWPGFHLGNSAHKAIAAYYGATHLGRVVYKNTATMGKIADENGGNRSVLHADEVLLCPDITDMLDRVVFQIKSSTEGQLQLGQARVTQELAILNQALPGAKPFIGGTGYSGELGIRFADDVSPWRLTWQTTSPGVVQYRFTKLNPKDASREAYREAYEKGQWVDLTAVEMEQYGEALANAVDMLVDNREFMAKVQSMADVPIGVVGISATSVLTAELSRLLTILVQKTTPAGRSAHVVLTFTRTKPPPATPTSKTPAPAPAMTRHQPPPPPQQFGPPPPP